MYKRYTNGVLDFHKENYCAVRSLHAKETNTHKEKARYKVGIDTILIKRPRNTFSYFIGLPLYTVWKIKRTNKW